MKPQIGLDILARQNKLTHEDWIELIEARLQKIKSSIRDMNPLSIGRMKIIHDYFGTHSIMDDNPEVIGKFDLETRGIFPCDRVPISITTEYHRKNGQGAAIAATEKFWGYTRNGKWISIELYTTNERVQYKHPDRTERRAYAKKITIMESTFTDICVFTEREPEYFWKRFGEVIKAWSEQREFLYDQSQKLAREVEFEEILLGRISK